MKEREMEEMEEAVEEEEEEGLEELKSQFFHHYETKENIATANTVSLFMHLYQCDDDRTKFFNFLKELFKEEVEGFEPDSSEPVSFELQKRNTKDTQEKSTSARASQESQEENIGDTQKERNFSVPDACISQANFFKIVIETKLSGNPFEDNQLIEHLNSFASEEHKILVTLAPAKMPKESKNEFDEKLKRENKSISHVNLTFSDLVLAMGKVASDASYRVEMSEVLEDYKDYCDHDDLLVDPSHRMIVRPVGNKKNKNSTYEINNRYKVYFNRQAPDYASSYGYLGLYRDKSVCAIGKICDQITICEIENEKLKNLLECEESKDAIKKVIRAIKLECEEEKKDNLTSPEQTIIEKRKDTIKKVIEKMLLDHGDKTILRKQRYYFVEEFHETNFKKVSRYGLLKSKKFNLEKELGKDNLAKILGKNEHNAKGIAEALKGKTWE